MELLTAAASSAQYDIDNIVPILFMPVQEKYTTPSLTNFTHVILQILKLGLCMHMQSIYRRHSLFFFFFCLFFPLVHVILACLLLVQV